jgi:hypothetical protein
MSLVLIDPSELARRLGVARERLTLEVVMQPQGQEGMVVFHMLVDGRDLTPSQEKIANRFISEVIGSPAATLKTGVA